MRYFSSNICNTYSKTYNKTSKKERQGQINSRMCFQILTRHLYLFRTTFYAITDFYQSLHSCIYHRVVSTAVSRITEITGNYQNHQKTISVIRDTLSTERSREYANEEPRRMNVFHFLKILSELLV